MFEKQFRYLLAATTLITGMVSGQAAQAETITLEPHSTWAIDYAEDSCALRRYFGGEGAPVFLEMRQFAPESSLQFIIASEHYSLKRRNRARDIMLRFLPGEDAVRGNMPFNMAFDDDHKGFTFSSRFWPTQTESEIDPNSLLQIEGRDERESAISSIEIINGFRDNLIFQTGSMLPPMQAMRTCLDELLEHWGIDAEAHRTLSQIAQPVDIAEWAQKVLDV